MTDFAQPILATGVAVWAARAARAQIRCIGRTTGTSRREALALARAVGPQGELAPEIAWARQVHSATVLQALPGECGEGDSLLTAQPGLALAISTADCVPLLLATGDRVAAVHAGWRGVVSGVVEATLDRLGEQGNAIEAWIGPAIGPCCYEVGEDVASQIEHAAGAAAVSRHDEAKPRADLQAAVGAQLERRGVSNIQTARVCTRCAVGSLWSYRRDGAAAGRNLAFVWLTSET